MVNSERFELEDFLKIFKMGESLVLTIRNNLKVIQGVNQLIGSTTAINRVITNKVIDLCINQIDICLLFYLNIVFDL